MKALVGAFNQAKALVGAFSVIYNFNNRLIVYNTNMDTICVAARHLSIVSAALRPISRFMWMKGSEEGEREAAVTRSGENRNLELGEDV